MLFLFLWNVCSYLSLLYHTSYFGQNDAVFSDFGEAFCTLGTYTLLYMSCKHFYQSIILMFFFFNFFFYCYIIEFIISLKTSKFSFLLLNILSIYNLSSYTVWNVDPTVFFITDYSFILLTFKNMFYRFSLVNFHHCVLLPHFFTCSSYCMATTLDRACNLHLQLFYIFLINLQCLLNMFVYEFYWKLSAIFISLNFCMVSNRRKKVFHEH